MVNHISAVAGKTFDYVVVGGGTAGLVVAAKLSEDPKISVVVLEAGPANLNDPRIQRPASYGSHFGDQQYDWGHQSTKQGTMNDRVCTWHRGKGLGGSSGINFLCYTEPPAREVDDWERLGNAGWNWESFKRALTSVEGFNEPPEEFIQKFDLRPKDWDFGRDGPVKLGFPPLVNGAERKIQETLDNAGIPQAAGPFSGDPDGYFFLMNTYDAKSHSRSYATSAFYEPNKDRPNLVVLPLALVQRVVTESGPDGTLKATGVAFAHDGSTYTVNATREVVLCAGSLKSPQLLELSGIGRKEVLDKIGVDLKVDLPGVGENAQEHLVCGISHELKDHIEFDTIDALRDSTIAEREAQLLAQGKGLYTLGMVSCAFMTLKQFTTKADDIYEQMRSLLRAKASSQLHPGLREQLELQVDRCNPRNGSPTCEMIAIPGFFSFPNPPEPGKRYISLTFITNNVLSRSNIHCTTANPDCDPEYDARYFEDDIDLEVFVEGIKFLRSLAATAPLRDMFEKELNPGPSVQSDAELKQWIKHSFHSGYHTTSSCAMLPRDKNGVVDASLKVYGTSNLRIADLSIVPLQVSTHLQSVAYAIGVRAAEIIKTEASL